MFLAKHHSQGRRPVHLDVIGHNVAHHISSAVWVASEVHSARTRRVVKVFRAGNGECPATLGAVARIGCVGVGLEKEQASGASGRFRAGSAEGRIRAVIDTL